MQIYLIFFLEGHYFLDIQYLVQYVQDVDTHFICKSLYNIGQDFLDSQYWQKMNVMFIALYFSYENIY